MTKNKKIASEFSFIPPGSSAVRGWVGVDIVPGWKDVLKLNPAQCGRTLKFLLTVLLHSLLSLFMGDSTSLTPLAFLWQPLALLGCHITPSSLCCLSSLLSPSFLLPVYCIPFSSHCVSRQLFGKGVIIGQPVSHFS